MTLLLDTHAAIWLAQKEPMRREAIIAIDRARDTARVLLSAASVWELSTLIAKQRIKLDQPLGSWVRTFVTSKGFESVPLTIPMAIEAAEIPLRLLKDPADRFLVGTARHLDVPLVTRDKRILEYASAGHIRILKC
jgi:PIN domain nuclease of toxin-antitoxin system